MSKATDTERRMAVSRRQQCHAAEICPMRFRWARADAAISCTAAVDPRLFVTWLTRHWKHTFRINEQVSNRTPAYFPSIMSVCLYFAVERVQDRIYLCDCSCMQANRIIQCTSKEGSEHTPALASNTTSKQDIDNCQPVQLLLIEM
jgi:hypothetical protein